MGSWGWATGTTDGRLTFVPNTVADCHVWFEWGLTTAHGSGTTPQTMTSTGAFSAGLSGLTPGTTYYYRAVADDGAGDTVFGARDELQHRGSAVWSRLGQPQHAVDDAGWPEIHGVGWYDECGEHDVAVWRVQPGVPVIPLVQLCGTEGIGWREAGRGVGCRAWRERDGRPFSDGAGRARELRLEMGHGPVGSDLVQREGLSYPERGCGGLS